MSDKKGFGVSSNDLFNFVTVWRERFKCQIFFPCAVDELWALETITDASDLADAINWLSIQLGVLPSIPRRTAQVIVEAQHKNKIVKSNQDYSVFNEKKSWQIRWQRDLNAYEKSAQYVHCFDKRRMYLSAFNIHFGVGNYDYIEDSMFLEKHNDFAGLYEVELAMPRASDIDDKGDFPLWHQILFQNRQASKYVFTPELRLAKENGALIKYKRAWVFKQTERVFERFYNTIKIAIDKAKDEKNKVAESCCKATYSRFVGWLFHEPARKEWDTPFYRPDWGSLIISEANSRLVRNLLKVKKETSLEPFGIRVDGVMYFSHEPNAAKALPSPFTGVNAQYSHEWTASGDAVRELIKQGVGVGKIDDLAKAGELK